MRKWATGLLILGILVTAAAPIGARGPRKSGADYRVEDRNHHVGGPGAGGGVWDTEDAYEFALMRGERFISVDIQDEREQPVAGIIVQRVWDYEAGSASVGHSVTHVHFCGSTVKPVKVEPGITVEVELVKGTCQDGTPSMPTNGHIFAKIYKR